MNPKQLAEAGKKLFGSNWKVEMARRFGVYHSTVRRWANGEIKVPKTAEAAINCWLRERSND